MTVWGPWAYSDSTVYIVSARNLAQGQGLGVQMPGGGFAPSSGHPPLYQTILAAATIVGMNTLEAARWLDIVLYAAGILFLGLGLLRLGWPRWIVLVGIAAFFIHPLVLDIYSGAMTEPLFTTLTLGWILSLTLALTESRAQTWYAAATACLGLALLTRYPGMAQLGAAAVGLVLFGREDWKHRFLRATYLSLAAALPALIWLGLLAINPAVDSPRSMAWDLAGLSKNLQVLRVGIVDVIWSWLPFTRYLPEVHYRVHLAAVVATGLILAAPTLGFIVKNGLTTVARGDQATRSAIVFATLAGLAALGHLAVFSIAFVLSRAKPDFSTRVLSPLFIFGFLWLLADISLLARTWPTRRLIPILGTAAIVLFSANSFPKALEKVEQMHQSGGGYSGRVWRQSELLEAVAALPPKIDLASNEPALILLWTGRAAHPLDLLLDPPSDPTQIQPFGLSLDDSSGQAFREGKLVLVLFNTFPNELQAYYGDKAEPAVEGYVSGLATYFSGRDGTIYVWPRTTPSSDK